MSRYLLDANVLSEPMRQSPDKKLMERLQRFEYQSCTVSIVWHELWRGVLSMPAGRRRDVVRRYLEEALAPQLLILPYDQEAATRHAVERVRLETVGSPPPFADGQIAAIALVHDLTLVTANGKDYAGFSGLRIEDWRSD